MHEGHWDLTNPFSVEIILVYHIFIKYLICSCHFARLTNRNAKKKKSKKFIVSYLQESRYRRKMQTYSWIQTKKRMLGEHRDSYWDWHDDSWVRWHQSSLVCKRQQGKEWGRVRKGTSGKGTTWRKSTGLF